ncbi:TetR/AcrR family transcriptional regulator [Sphingomonas sp.]|uniref:TetR/AcrR family transcriptional regulator n=1 Tax=Sphingomonas sp. TaxID=28214 RepID=UPI002C104316|nr:TetR/AcrR family transcriptional regulator [Sphingomonas sp.]HWK36593.1 TetR/AcrR family transcriptional regulator [Sphingomonas sp.]
MSQPPQDDRRPSRRGRPKDIAREASIERILDAAEQLFAEYGYHGVTMKGVAQAIGVSPTLLHYHFNGKESIFEAVWARKAPISARKRLAAMQDYAATAGDAVTVEGALRVWIDTDLDLQIEQTEYWSAFGRIAAQANSAGGWGSEKMSTYFDPVAATLVDLLKRAMPGTSEERIFWGFHFVSGAMTHNLARTGRLDRMSGGLCSSDDFHAIKAHMVTFMAAGFKAICQPG